MRNIVFSEENYYHIYNRGVEKRAVFLDRADYQRFLSSMSAFNTSKRVEHLDRVDTSCRQPGRLVEIVAYCLMPNHFHFLIKQVAENGVSRYMHKVLMGYTKYFNKRYERSGVLFQGVFQGKHVGDNSYLLELSRYIHLNPLDLVPGITSPKMNYIQAFPWSSLSEYINKKPDTSLVSDEMVVLGQFSGPEAYLKFLKDGLEH